MNFINIFKKKIALLKMYSNDNLASEEIIKRIFSDNEPNYLSYTCIFFLNNLLDLILKLFYN